MTAQQKQSAEVLADATTDSDKTRYAARPKNDPTLSCATQMSEGSLIKQRYRLDVKIDSGGMSDIYKASDAVLTDAGIEHNVVALKVLQNTFADQPEALQLLIQEAQSTKQLSHPNIVRVFDVDHECGQYFIVMELLDGENLQQLIKRSKPNGLSFNATLKILLQIANALEHAHQIGIVHADLKPANIMIDRSGKIKVLDFGVAQKLHLNRDLYAAEPDPVNPQLSGYTPAYASPQLLTGEIPTVADDVFSFACLAYELLSSRHPFDRTPADIAKQQQLLAKKPQHVNQLQWLALKQALSFDYTKRQTSIRQLVDQLQRSVWKPVFLISTASLLLFTGVQIYQAEQTTIAELQQTVANTTASTSRYQQLAAASAEAFLRAIQSDKNLSSQDYVHHGLLRLQQQNVLQYFEQQIETIVSDRAYNYPDYSKIEQLLSTAKSLYPDSQYLQSIALNMFRSKQTAIDVLREKLNQLLLNRQYQQSSTNESVYTILQDLARIDLTYKVIPTEAETQVYSDAFAAALETNSATDLKQLIEVGQTVFSDQKDTLDIINFGKVLNEAVLEVSNYQQRRADGQNVAFPYGAAEKFYQHSFDKLKQALQQSGSAEAVDAVYAQLQQYDAILPTDFSLHVEMRRKLADKYLNLSGELLKSNQVRAAERLMRKANTLMNSLSG